LFCVHGITVPGYASTIIAILVLGGVQLLAVGIMGEYLGRLHLNVNCKPQYVERRVAGQSAPPENRLSAASSHNPISGLTREADRRCHDALLS
jgi:hypothetical protein